MMNIYKTLKDDIWRIIEGNEPEDKEFLTYVLYLLVNRKRFKMKEAIESARKIERVYNEELEKVTESIQNNHGEILKVLKELKNDLQQKINPILTKLNGNNDTY